ncbi:MULTISPECIES: hypothetical protein [Salinimonas]|uniref:Uncharacterized protein n=2 Tax=Salinimonas TaxID=288793 RepID=A0A5B7YJS9_9ALTE|nr:MULTISPECIES: hypothetical protein [Salinimonas]MBD3587534.1 hypothetical protein [Salinimonas profundi]QCZ95553.1 hypothetical protein FBQ74_18710 [Salinimonas iocasae]
MIDGQATPFGKPHFLPTQPNDEKLRTTIQTLESRFVDIVIAMNGLPMLIEKHVSNVMAYRHDKKKKYE